MALVFLKNADGNGKVHRGCEGGNAPLCNHSGNVSIPKMRAINPLRWHMIRPSEICKKCSKIAGAGVNSHIHESKG